MEFFYCSELDSKYKGYYSSYDNKKQKNTNATFCDIRTFINENQKRWLNSIEEWHSELCRIGSRKTPYWWLVDGSRF